jgi:hypothetical protein
MEETANQDNKQKEQQNHFDLIQAGTGSEVTEELENGEPSELFLPSQP